MSALRDFCQKLSEWETEAASGNDRTALLRLACTLNGEPDRAWSERSWQSVLDSDLSVPGISKGFADCVLAIQNVKDRAGLSATYFRMLASNHCPVELFSPFAFSLAWKSLHDACKPRTKLPSVDADADVDDVEEDPADDPQIIKAALQTARAALEHARVACGQISLRSKPESLATAVEHACGIMLDVLTLEPKGKQKNAVNLGTLPGQISAAASAVLLTLLHPDVVPDDATALQLVLNFTPGLRGCSHSGGDTQRPSPALRDATVRLLTQLPAAHQPAVLRMLQNALLQAPDKAAQRNALADAAAAVAAALPPSAEARWLHFLALLSFGPNATLRLLALQVLGPALTKLLTCGSEDDRDDGCGGTPAPAATPAARGTAGELRLPCSKAQLLVAVLVQRCADKHSSVRAKAMTVLSDLLEALLEGGGAGGVAHSGLARMMQHAHALQVDSAAVAAAAPPPERPAAGTPGSASPQPLASPAAPAPPADAPDTCFLAWAPQAAAQVDADALLTLVASLANDSKASGRKGSAQLLVSLLILFSHDRAAAARRGEHLAVLEALASDSSVTVRKGALAAAARLAAAVPDDGACAALWARVVLPLLQDSESSVQDAVRAEVWRHLLEPLARLGSIASKKGTLDAALLRHVRCVMHAACGQLAGFDACLRAVCQGLVAKLRTGPDAGHITAAVQRVLQADAAMPMAERRGLWTLLTEVAVVRGGAACLSFVLDRWAELRLEAAGLAAEGDAAGDAGGEAGRNGEATPGTAVEGTPSALAVWQDETACVLRVLIASAKQLTTPQAGALADELFGTLCQRTPPPQLAALHITLLSMFSIHSKLQPAACAAATWQAEVYAACEQSVLAYLEAGWQAAEARAVCERACRAVFVTGQTALDSGVMPPAALVTLVQALTSPSELQQQTARLTPHAGAGGGAAACRVPGVLQAHAWAALGKLGLVSEPLGRSITPLMVKELGRSRVPCVRNNALLALSDLCMQYTLLVDTHLWRIARSMQDPHPLVRKQALALLAGLLQKEYVKWRGPLFVQYLLALVDDSPTVRQMASLLLKNVLTTKAPTLAHNHFLEVVFLLNAASHIRPAASRKADKETEQADAAFSLLEKGCKSHANLVGPSNQARAHRFVIYKVLLNSMQPQYKFAVMDRMCEEVVTAAADGILPIEPCAHVIWDVLHLLYLPELKVGVSGKEAPAEEDIPLDDGTQSQSQANPGASQARMAAAAAGLVKKHLLEKLVPAVAALKGALEEGRHWLQQDAMLCLVGLLSGHKDDVEDILVSQRQLAAEIKFTMQEQQRKRRVTKLRRNAAACTPSTSTPAPRLTPISADKNAIVSPRLPTATPHYLPPNMRHLAATPHRALPDAPAGASLQPARLPTAAAHQLGGVSTPVFAPSMLPRTAQRANGAAPGTTSRTPVVRTPALVPSHNRPTTSGAAALSLGPVNSGCAAGTPDGVGLEPSSSRRAALLSCQPADVVSIDTRCELPDTRRALLRVSLNEEPDRSRAKPAKSAADGGKRGRGRKRGATEENVSPESAAA